MYWKLSIQTIEGIFEHKKHLTKALMIPFICYLVLTSSPLFVSNPWLILIFSLLSYIVDIIVAITTHRMILLGPGSVPEWGILKWSRREILFGIHFLVLAGAPFAVTLLGTLGMNFTGTHALSTFFKVFLGVILFATLFIIIPIAYAKLSLAFPAIAIDRNTSIKDAFKDAWKLAESNVELLIIMIFIFPLLFALPFILSLLWAYKNYSDFMLRNEFVFQTLQQILYFPFTVLFIAFLSFTYKHIIEAKQIPQDNA